MRSIIGNLILLLLPFIFLVVLFTQKDKLTNYVSAELKLQTGTEMQASIQKIVDSLYNYKSNDERYRLTFLEFGAKGCIACRKMEFVLDEVRQEYPGKVKVVFLNISQIENQAMMKYYGVVEIPTQVLLNENGEEFFRHTGYYSFEDLKKEFEIN